VDGATRARWGVAFGWVTGNTPGRPSACCAAALPGPAAPGCASAPCPSIRQWWREPAPV